MQRYWRELSMNRLVMMLVAAVVMSTANSLGHADATIQTFPVQAGAGPHDVYPAPDGAVWFTAQSEGKLGRLDPRPRRAHGTRRPLRPGRRVHGGGARALEYLGRRRADPRQGEQPLCRSGQGASARSYRPVLPVARAVHRAAVAARASGADPSGAVRP